MQKPLRKKKRDIGGIVLTVLFSLVCILYVMPIVEDLPALPGGVLHQHRLLVPDAAGVIGFALLISVLLGQAAVNSCFHARISFQEIEQAISAIIIP